MDAKIIEGLKAAHPDAELHALSTKGITVVVKTPGRAEWRRFKAAQADDKKRLDAPEVLLKACAVYPEMTILDDMLSRQPGLIERLAVEVIELAGMAEEVEKKRL